MEGVFPQTPIKSFCFNYTKTKNPSCPNVPEGIKANCCEMMDFIHLQPGAPSLFPADKWKTKSEWVYYNKKFQYVNLQSESHLGHF